MIFKNRLRISTFKYCSSNYSLEDLDVDSNKASFTESPSGLTSVHVRKLSSIMASLFMLVSESFNCFQKVNLPVKNETLSTQTVCKRIWVIHSVNTEYLLCCQVFCQTPGTGAEWTISVLTVKLLTVSREDRHSHKQIPSEKWWYQWVQREPRVRSGFRRCLKQRRSPWNSFSPEMTVLREVWRLVCFLKSVFISQ